MTLNHHRFDKKAYMKQWYQKNRERRLRYNRDYRQQHQKEKLEYNRKYNRLHPQIQNRTSEQIKAHNFVSKHQDFLDSNCELCGSTEKLCGHHLDYSLPEIVVTICKSCHNWIHKGCG